MVRVGVGGESRLSSNGGLYGNGGDVIVWSEDQTIFRGYATATGGSELGDGGLVEISGKTQLGFSGYIDVTSLNGSSGQVLFDPANIRFERGVGDSLNGSISFLDSNGENLFIDIDSPENIVNNNINSDWVFQADNDIETVGGNADKLHLPPLVRL